MKVDLVIAHYKEPLDWLAPAVARLKSKDYEITPYIYTKGDIEIEGHKSLPNIGRESHTYLHHILVHYHEYQTCKSENYIVFAQAGFFDHASMWFKGYTSHVDLLDAMIQDAVKHNGASLSFATKHEYVGYNAAHWDFRIAMHNGRPVTPRAESSFGPWFVSNISPEFPRHGLLDWWISALFCVKGLVVASSHDRDYYNHLIKQLNFLDPEVGHYFERSWVYITGANNLRKPDATYPMLKNKRVL